jgi:DNA topoisomerase-1
MMVAQQLYEGVRLKKDTLGLITYIRTDSTRISDEAATETEKYILSNYGSEYLPGKRRVYKNKSQSQDSHEAIRPSSVELTPESIKEYLTKDQFKLYKLIWQRMVASQMASSLAENIKAKISGGKFVFAAQSSKVLFDGFSVVFDGKEKEEKSFVGDLKEGEKLLLDKVTENQHFTQPPARYTEASLVKTLEEMGIGRPSTYAPTIMTILARGYVVKEDKKFFPTEMGLIVNELLTSYFSRIIDYDFTAQLEENLDKIEEGSIEWKEVIREFYVKFAVDLEKAEKEINKIEIKPEESEEKCDKCGRNMVVKIGRYGKFLACPGFPDCRNIKPLLEETGVKCPSCETGNIVVRRSKKGRKFFGCSNFPECDFVSWEEPSQVNCPECGNFMTKTSVKNKVKFKCSNKKCGHEFEKSKED